MKARERSESAARSELEASLSPIERQKEKTLLSGTQAYYSFRGRDAYPAYVTKTPQETPPDSARLLPDVPVSPEKVEEGIVVRPEKISIDLKYQNIMAVESKANEEMARLQARQKELQAKISAKMTEASRREEEAFEEEREKKAAADAHTKKKEEKKASNSRKQEKEEKKASNSRTQEKEELRQKSHTEKEDQPQREETARSEAPEQIDYFTPDEMYRNVRRDLPPRRVQAPSWAVPTWKTTNQTGPLAYPPPPPPPGVDVYVKRVVASDILPFEEIDVNNDGVISREEWERKPEMKQGSQRPSSFLINDDDMMKEKARSKAQSLREKARRLFDKHDIKRRGFLDVEQFELLLCHANSGMTSSEVRDTVLDYTAQGGNTVTFADFMSMMAAGLWSDLKL